MPIQSIDHYIAGQAVANTSGRTQDVTNPATGAVTCLLYTSPSPRDS